ADLREMAEAGDDRARTALIELLADRGREEELRAEAERGDGAALYALVGLMTGGGRIGEALELLDGGVHPGLDRPARALRLEVLLGAGREEEVRRLADAGDRTAARALVDRLADRGDIEGLAERARAGDDRALWRGAGRLSSSGRVGGAAAVVRAAPPRAPRPPAGGPACGARAAQTAGGGERPRGAGPVPPAGGGSVKAPPHRLPLLRSSRRAVRPARPSGKRAGGIRLQAPPSHLRNRCRRGQGCQESGQARRTGALAAGGRAGGVARRAGRTDRFRAAVVGAGVSDWGMLAATGEFGAGEAGLSGSVGWEGPGPHPQDAVSPVSFASQIRTPVLVLHGEQDANVPVGQA